MRAFGVLALLSACGIGAAISQPTAAEAYVPDAPDASQAADLLTVNGPNPDGWAFPITEVDQHLPSLIQFGGQFRDRWEEAGNIGYSPVGDGYDLTQLRLGIYIPAGEVVRDRGSNSGLARVLQPACAHPASVSKHLGYSRSLRAHWE